MPRKFARSERMDRSWVSIQRLDSGSTTSTNLVKAVGRIPSVLQAEDSDSTHTGALVVARKCTVLAVACAGQALLHWFALGRVRFSNSSSFNVTDLPRIEDNPEAFYAVFGPSGGFEDKQENFRFAYSGMSRARRILAAGDAITFQGSSSVDMPECTRILLGY